MRPIRTAYDLRRLGNILSIWAHPDDETFTCAGIMAAALRNGQNVRCITATHGEKGMQNSSAYKHARMGSIRTTEMQNALRIIGVSDHVWLNYSDGGCDDRRVNGTSDIAALLFNYRPDTILTFGPEGLTGHSDHVAVSQWVSSAVGMLDFDVNIYHAVEETSRYEQHLKAADKEFNIYFNIDHPIMKSADECDIAFQLSPELCKLKHDAFQAMDSQTHKLLAYFDRTQSFDEVFCCETFVAI